MLCSSISLLMVLYYEMNEFRRCSEGMFGIYMMLII